MKGLRKLFLSHARHVARIFLCTCTLGCFASLIPNTGFAQQSAATKAQKEVADPSGVAQLTVQLPGTDGPQQLVPTLKILLLFTILAIAPAILISVTSFTRIVIVLSFLRQAIGTQNVPPMQVILSLSLLLTMVVMTPVGLRLNKVAIEPYLDEKIDEGELWKRSKQVMQDFLLAQTREDDLLLFYEISKTPKPKTKKELHTSLLVPAFMISELRTGFEMGFLLFLPFVLVDLIVSAVLTAMGMMMLPPTMVSTPLKLLLFVIVDGWSLLSRSLVSSFGG